MEWFFLIVGIFLAVRVAVSLKAGRIGFGWVFEPLVAERHKNKFAYWYMILFSAIAGIFALVMAVYAFIFPTD
jgi:hypothetical protein